jgi:hypothetical protein
LLRFAHEALDGFGVVRLAKLENLQCNVTLEQRVGGAIDCGKAAASEFGVDTADSYGNPLKSLAG